MNLSVMAQEEAITLRAGERVEAFLNEQVARHMSRPGQALTRRLPSVKQLAQTLSVSPRTVASVYRDYAKQGLLQTRVGRGTFLTSQSKSQERLNRNAAAVNTQPVVGIDLAPEKLAQDSGAWGSLVFQGLLDAASHDDPLMLLPLARPHSEDKSSDPSASLLEHLNHVDALVLFAPTGAESVAEAYLNAGRPVVCLNPISVNATADFVSPDYFSASRTVGQAFVAGGRQRVALLISGALERSVSTQIRLSGLVAGLGTALGETVELRVFSALGPDHELGRAAIEPLLTTDPAERWVPDAIYCAGDMLALGALAACREHGLEAPRDVAVVGGTGYRLERAEVPELTRCQQPLTEIGREIMFMVRQQLTQPERPCPQPGRYLAMPFVGGHTTNTQENQVLGID